MPDHNCTQRLHAVQSSVKNRPRSVTGIQLQRLQHSTLYGFFKCFHVSENFKNKHGAPSTGRRLDGAPRTGGLGGGGGGEGGGELNRDSL